MSLPTSKAQLRQQSTLALAVTTAPIVQLPSPRHAHDRARMLSGRNRAQRISRAMPGLLTQVVHAEAPIPTGWTPTGHIYRYRGLMLPTTIR